VKTSPPSFEAHVAYAQPAIRPILLELRKRISALGPAIKETVTRQKRITYGAGHAFVEIKVQKERILVRVFGTGQPDPRGVVTPIPKSHNWSHDEELAINSQELVDYAMGFVKASYARSLKDH
jgi:predicted transport protein